MNKDIPVQGLSLALLAALAVAGPRGLTRDRVLSLLWPEVDGPHAAHRLTQLNYALRKTVLTDPVIGTSDLLLDPSAVMTDVQRFTAALSEGELEEAVRLADGPFLDGFYLREAPEFDRWVEGVRWEFKGRLDAALARLVAAADERGDAGRAAHWLEQIVRGDPLNEAAAVRTLAAYEAAGNLAHARHLGEWLERTLHEEYEAAPEAALRTAIDRLRAERRAAPDVGASTPTIAVLPLRNVSPEPENEFFSDGMTDDISGALARVPGLRVASRTSTYAFKGKAVDIRQIASRLGATLVVEGSLRKVGNRIRLMAQLVSAADGCELWSATFDRTVSDVFELQAELASAIVRALPLGSIAAAPLGAQVVAPTDPETYSLYLKGRYWAYKRTVEALQLATEYFDQAVERDRGYALGWTGIAECQMMLGFPEYCNLPPRRTMPRAKAAATRALKLAPALPEARLLSGVLSLIYDWDWAAAEHSLREALRLRPIYPLAECWYSMFLSAMGRHEEAVRRVERASALDPLALLIHLSVGRALYFAHRFDEALRSIQATVEMEPAHPLVRIWHGRALLAMGRYDEALQAVEGVERVLALDGYLDCVRAAALVGLGRNDVVLSDPFSPWSFMVGTHDRAEECLASLERCWDERIGHLPWLAIEPLCDPLRQHPRFAALMERMGLAVVATPRPSPGIADGSRKRSSLKRRASSGWPN